MYYNLPINRGEMPTKYEALLLTERKFGMHPEHHRFQKAWCRSKEKSVHHLFKPREPDCIRLERLEREQKKLLEPITIVPQVNVDPSRRGVRWADREGRPLTTDLRLMIVPAGTDGVERQPDWTRQRPCIKFSSPLEASTSNVPCAEVPNTEGGFPWTTTAGVSETVQACTTNLNLLPLVLILDQISTPKSL